MIKVAPYVMFFVGMAGFMWWRFYVSARDQVATVKWAGYRMSNEPITYWLSTSMMAIGALLTSLIALAFGYGLITGLIG